MNAARSAMPTDRAAIVSDAPQPCVSALDKPYTRPTRPADAVTAPGMSMSRLVVAAVSRPRRRSAANAVGTARITFTYMHQRQSRYSVRAPPRIRPTAAPEPAIAPNTPNAVLRSDGAVKVVVSRLRAAGASSAAKPPCTARATTRTPKLWARPPSADAPANPTAPATNTRLRPIRSPRRPPSSSRLPNDRAYAVTIHWRASLEKPKAFWAEGRAMFTIVTSSTTINCARPISARINQRRLLSEEAVG